MSLRHAAPALLAALLFGASTPLAKLPGGEVPPLLLARLLYVGSGDGLGVLLLARRAAAVFRPAGQGLTIGARVQSFIGRDIIYIMRISIWSGTGIPSP